MRPGLTHVGVVVPAHDEQLLLKACLNGLSAAIEDSPVPVELLVVLDSCSDASAEICWQLGVRTLRVEARNVGKARAAGIAALRRGWAEPSRLWLANTDADSVVPRGWIADQVLLADSGADVVLGLVELDDDEALASATRSIFHRMYDAPQTMIAHPHVHGANLGVRASSYLRVGGFLALPNHEDRELIRVLRTTPEVSVVSSIDLRVRTSARLDARCTEGFAQHLLSIGDC